MYKKLIVSAIILTILFSTSVFASSFSSDVNMFPFSFAPAQPKTEAVNTDAPEYLRKEYESENSLSLVTFLRPESFDTAFVISKDAFNISCKAQSEGLVIRLMVYDVEQGIFVPVKKEIVEPDTELKISVDTTWKFGLSGYLLCNFRIPAEGQYLYRLMIHKAGLEKDLYQIGTNLQLLDFVVNYKKLVSFENVLVNSFWDIYFDASKYSLPLLP